MSAQFLDLTAPSVQGGLIRTPESLPHGLIRPPARVLELIAREKAKFPPEDFSSATEARITDDWTLQYYFDYLGHEVLYRQTPQGPEVLAVGVEEILPLKKTLPLEEQRQLKTYLPY